MSKGNKKIRNDTLGGINWWTYINSIRPKGNRNEPQYIDKTNIQNTTKIVKITDKMVKERKRIEKKRLNMAKFAKKIVKPTKKAKRDMIQNGIDVAEKWSE